MTLLWQVEEGHFACRWVEVGVCPKYNPEWMQGSSQAQSGYLSPLPNFADRGHFGGVSWFQPDPTDSD